MQEFKRQQERNGNRQFSGGFSSELATLASQKWNEMTAQERGPYVRQAKEAKHTVARNNEQYTSQGVAYSTIEKARAVAEEAAAAMHLEINELVKKSFLDNSTCTRYIQLYTNHVSYT